MQRNDALRRYRLYRSISKMVGIMENSICARNLMVKSIDQKSEVKGQSTYAYIHN